jgi:hypothetical protein
MSQHRTLAVLRILIEASTKGQINGRVISDELYWWPSGANLMRLYPAIGASKNKDRRSKVQPAIYDLRDRRGLMGGDGKAKPDGVLMFAANFTN